MIHPLPPRSHNPGESWDRRPESRRTLQQRRHRWKRLLRAGRHRLRILRDTWKKKIEIHLFSRDCKRLVWWKRKRSGLLVPLLHVCMFFIYELLFYSFCFYGSASCQPFTSIPWQTGCSWTALSIPFIRRVWSCILHVFFCSSYTIHQLTFLISFLALVKVVLIIKMSSMWCLSAAEPCGITVHKFTPKNIWSAVFFQMNPK